MDGEVEIRSNWRGSAETDRLWTWGGTPPGYLRKHRLGKGGRENKIAPARTHTTSVLVAAQGPVAAFPATNELLSTGQEVEK